LISGLSNSGLDPLKCAKRLLEGLWFTAKLTEVNMQSPVNSLKSCPSSLFSLQKKKKNRLRGRNRKRRQKLEESQKLKEKIDKKKNHEGKPKNRQGNAL
jgi:hypothetical protein